MKVAHVVGFAPTPSRLTAEWTTGYPTRDLVLHARISLATYAIGARRSMTELMELKVVGVVRIELTRCPGPKPGG